MRIKNIKINSFGNLKNKEINIENKINIIYGENEVGKSTILKYIISMLYGISRNKKGKNISDYEYYKPWENEEYSGKLIYELDDNNEFEIFRDFNKKSIQIYNKGNDISKEYNIDKVKGNQFFYEQTKIDEELFLSTQISMQEQVKLNKEDENILIQKISNILATGKDNTSYKKIMDKLNKKLIEDIGTDRTSERPLNLIERELKELKIKREELFKYNELKYKNEEDNIINKKQINIIEKKINLIKEIKKTNEEFFIEEEKIKINKDIYKKNEEKIIELKNKKEKLLLNSKKQNGKILQIASTSVLIVFNIINFILDNLLILKIRINIVVPNNIFNSSHIRS